MAWYLVKHRGNSAFIFYDVYRSLPLETILK